MGLRAPGVQRHRRAGRRQLVSSRAPPAVTSDTCRRTSRAGRGARSSSPSPRTATCLPPASGAPLSRFGSGCRPGTDRPSPLCRFPIGALPLRDYHQAVCASADPVPARSSSASGSWKGLRTDAWLDGTPWCGSTATASFAADSEGDLARRSRRARAGIGSRAKLLTIDVTGSVDGGAWPHRRPRGG